MKRIHELTIQVMNDAWNPAMNLIVLSRMFRLATIKVDKIEDQNVLFGIVASTTSFVSMVGAIIALIK